MSLFYITVPSKAYEVELRIKELGHSDIYVENGDLEDLNERFLYDENDIRVAKEPQSFVLRCASSSVIWDVIVAEDYMICHDRRGSTPLLDLDDQIKAEIRRYFLEKHLTDTMERFGIWDAMPSNSMDFRIAQALFCVPDDITEEVIGRFQFVGVGSSYGSTLTVCHASVYYGSASLDSPTAPLDPVGKEHPDDKHKTSTWSDFVKSIKSRLTVAQVVSEIRTNAVLTFDFLMFSVISSCLAVIGLLENSNLVLVAAMLISPMRAPLMAFTFGTVIKDRNLISVGGRTEIIGLSMMVISGYVTGLFLASECINGPWHKVTQWPTREMIARGRLRDLVLGAFFAVPSGMAMALSILAGNTGSLVGVALSAAVLIPAVDAGLFLGLGTFAYLKEGQRTNVWYESCDINRNESLRNHNAYIRNYEVHYCDNVINEFFILGAASLSLTAITIIILYLIAIFIFKVKEVAPYTTRKSLRRFWKEDLAVARHYNSKSSTAEDFRNSILREIDDSGNADEIRQGLDQDYVFRQINRRMGGSGGKAALEEFKMYYENNRKPIPVSHVEYLNDANARKDGNKAGPQHNVNQQGDGQNGNATTTQSLLTQVPTARKLSNNRDENNSNNQRERPPRYSTYSQLVGTSDPQRLVFGPDSVLTDRPQQQQSQIQQNQMPMRQPVTTNYSQPKPNQDSNRTDKRQWESYSMPTIGTQPQVTFPKRK